MDYFNISKKKWQDFLKIEDEDIPYKLVIDCKINYPKWIKIVMDKMTNSRVCWMPNLIIGDYKDELVGYGVCFGGPVASQYTHIYCKMGTKKIIQIGSGGGLQAKIELGDIILSEGVLCIDGSAQLYKQDSRFIEFDRTLLNHVKSELEDRKIPFHIGKTVCIYDILLWELKTFIDLNRSGYIGADMESGGVGSAAKYFGTPAISFYVCSDNSASGKDLFYKQTKEEQEKVRRGFDAILDIALEM